MFGEGKYPQRRSRFLINVVRFVEEKALYVAATGFCFFSCNYGIIIKWTFLDRDT